MKAIYGNVCFNFYQKIKKFKEKIFQNLFLFTLRASERKRVRYEYKNTLEAKSYLHKTKRRNNLKIFSYYVKLYDNKNYLKKKIFIMLLKPFREWLCAINNYLKQVRKERRKNRTF